MMSRAHVAAPALQARTCNIAALCLCTMLAACATLEPKTAEMRTTVPAEFVATPVDAGAVIDQWWTRFGDPLLDALIAEAVKDSPTVTQALARARGGLFGLSFSFFPMVGVIARVGIVVNNGIIMSTP